MIPTLLLVGLVTGAVVTRGKLAILVAATFSLAWGLIVGVGDGSVATFAGGVGLGAANFVVGAVIGAIARWPFTRLTRRQSTPTSLVRTRP